VGGTARSVAAWLPVNLACVNRNFSNSLLTAHFVQLFSGNSSVNLFEFPMPQTDRKSKYVKEQ